MSIHSGLKQRAHRLKTETYALYLAVRHPQTPWYAKVLVAGIVACALSPVDLIPDFIPILGYLDDLILIPLGIGLALKMISPEVLAECRERAKEVLLNDKPVSRIAGAVIILVWIAVSVLCVVWVYRIFSPKN